MKVSQFRAVLKRAAEIKRRDGRQVEAQALLELSAALSRSKKPTVIKAVNQIKKVRGIGK